MVIRSKSECFMTRCYHGSITVTVLMREKFKFKYSNVHDLLKLDRVNTY